MTPSFVSWEVLSFLLLPWPGFSALRRRWDDKTGVRKALDRRYANGEITREEYLTTRDDNTRNSDA
jgi:uncharacterized membrane protein